MWIWEIIYTGTERKVRMCRVCAVCEKKKKKKREGRQDDKLARTHQCQAQPVFFKIRPSVRVAILS